MHVKKQITNLTIKNMKKFTFLFTLLFFAISTFAADYYVAGTSSLCGSNWSNNDAANKMELVDGIYKKVYSNVPTGSHEFKITNGTWDNSKGAGNVDASTSTPGYTGNDNISFVLIASTTITISYNESTDKITLKAEGLDKFGEFSISSYTLCGDFPCFGGDWAPANSDNDMTQGDNGTWTKTYENVNLEAKTYEYKVAANHNWGQGEFPTQGNGQYEIKEAGSYNLTFSYNPSKPELSCSATKVGENQNPSTTIPNGTALYLVPGEWTSDNARFAAYFFGGDGELWLNMIDTDNDGIYEVVCQGTREKVIFVRMNPAYSDNIWDNKWNQTNDLTYDGFNNKYTITGWGEGDGANSTGTWSVHNDGGQGGDNTGGDNTGGDNPGGNDKPNVDPNAESYTLCGDSIIFGSNWDETDTNNDMTKDDNGIWTKEYIEIELAKGTYEYKVVANHTWGAAGQYPANETNMTLYLPKNDIYNLTFTYNPMNAELKCTYTSKTMVNVENVTIDQIYTIGGEVFANTDFSIYTITGQDVTNFNGNLERGIYIVKTINSSIKVIIK